MAIRLWAAELTRPLQEYEEQALLQMLPPERREHLLRVQNHERWREPLCAYAILRHALWQEYHWKEFPQIKNAEQGKPFFPDFPTVHFNLSHTGGAVLVGLSDQALGVDLERIRPVSKRAMIRIAGVTSERAFYRSWVRREARAKCSGAGIGGMMEGEPPLQPGEYFYELDLFDGFVGGVAAKSAEKPDELTRYTLDELF